MRSFIPSIVISLLLMASLLSCDAESITQPPERPTEPESEFTYGGTNDDLGKTIIRTQDGGFLIVGTTTSVDGIFSGQARGNRDVFALKLTANGTQQWVNTYGGSNSDWAMDVIQDAGGDFIITGYNRSDDDQFPNMNRGENDIFLIKISPSNGELIWNRTYGGADEDYGYALTQGTNGGYLIAGSTRSVNGNFSDRSTFSKDAFVMLTDNSGQIEWLETFGGAENDEALDLTIGPNGQIAVVGSYSSSDSEFSGRQPGESGAFLLKLEPNGIFNSLYTYSGTGAEIANSIVTTSDNGFAIAGRFSSDNGIFQNLNSGENDAFVLKTSDFGTIQWLNTYGGTNTEELTGIAETENGNIAAVGHTTSDDGDFEEVNLGNTDIFMVNLSLSGSLNYLKTYGGELDETAESVIGLPNGNIAFTGWTLSNDGDFSGPQKSGRDIFNLTTSPEGDID
ncbi:hypothetical protein [Rhodohalobacter sp.]|uniref:hypothetical protein n=2 Tax=Rhodohalobacter sp. TaxID=1974210 RepID=UPI003974C846